MLRVPIPVPPGREGRAPALALVYSSGTGNSAFGAGWGLAGTQAVGIDTRFHVPCWDGTDGYQLSGDELVPWLSKSAGGWAPRGFTKADWSVAFLRSRRGGTNIRVEKWVHTPTGRVHFRTRDPGNVVTVYGARPNAAARVCDPADETRTVSWLPEVQIDPNGNALWFEYAAETLDGVDGTAPYERRQPSLAQRYLKRIRYGNVTPLVLTDALIAGTLPLDTSWCFQLVLDYGDHSDPLLPGVTPDRAWTMRKDPLSTFRNGFEIRTYRLCRRFLVFHDFNDLGENPTLVGLLALTHEEDPAGSTLRQVTRVGYRHDDGVATSKAVPPLRMTYAPSATDPSFLDAPAPARENVPAGLAASRYTFVDLFGEGLSGILAEGDRTWYYKTNLGNGEFAAQTALLERPAVRTGGYTCGDLNRNGDTDVSRMSGRFAGLYELDREEQIWTSFRPFSEFPHAEALGGHSRWVDLNGDGRPDLVLSKDDALVWFASAGDSFLPPAEIPRPSGADTVPTLAADPVLGLFFADMTGDGLVDLVRVRNGRVEYWPALGNGRFGDAVVMDGAPSFAADDEFDASRLRFVDLDGSGTTDIVYLGRGEVSCWINASGNCLIPGSHLTGLPYFDSVSTVHVLDFLADGSACLVWSSPLAGRGAPVEYLRLTPPDKPRLLLSVDDSMGREIHLSYSSSATHYLRDARNGRNWSTRLPSHHPVVDRRGTIDKIGGTSFVQRFEYHDGFYDGTERESRGFGHVDVYDMDTANGPPPSPAAAAVPPTALVRTWFHLGTSMWRHEAPAHTYTGDAALPVLPPHSVDDADQMTPDEIDDGLRAMAGRTIRTEIFAVDTTGAIGAHPFEVQQISYRLRRLQPATTTDRPAFAAIDAEKATWHYEQSPDDPRVSHRVLLVSDDYDLPIRDAIIGYARRAGRPLDVAAQGHHLTQVLDRSVLNVDQEDRYELGIPLEGKNYELVGVRPGPTGIFVRDQLRGPQVSNALAAPDPHYSDPPDDPNQAPRARLLSWDQTFYWDDARAAALPIGQVAALTLLHHEESACFAPAFVADALGGRVDDAQLIALGYVKRDELWWQADEVHSYAPAAQFSQQTSLRRGDGATTQFGYDPYALTVTSLTDPLGNTATAMIDYYQIAPWRVTDPNSNVSEVRYDPLGVITVATRYGHVGAQPWGFDALSAVAPRSPATLADVIADPAFYLQRAARYAWYDLEAWSRDGTPITSLALAREELVHDGAGGTAPASRIRVDIAYLDGVGRILQEKTLVEPGPAIQRDGAGRVVVDISGQPVLADVEARWRCSGHVVYDGKQRPSRRFEPFFSGSPAYEGDAFLSGLGMSALNRYDAMSRIIGRDFPNGTLARVTFTPWSKEEADTNDTVLDSAYGAQRVGLPASDPERQAYEEAKPHADTTRTTFFDPLGREVGRQARGGATAADQRSEIHLDIEGHARKLVDPRGLAVARARFDMQGRAVYQRSVDAGEMWTLTDTFDRDVITWDGRGFSVERGYDAGDRTLYTHVRGGDGATPLDHRVEEWVYGEDLAIRADAVARNLLGHAAIVRDGAGETAVERCDPAGRVMAVARRLRTGVDAEPDWQTATPLDAETFTTSILFDALGRVRSDTLVDGTTRTYEYLTSGALARVRLTTPDGTITNAPILDGTTVGARGEWLTKAFGNAVQLRCDYDDATHRVKSQTATRGGQTFQRIGYTYDPVGNIVRLTDDAQEGPNALIRGVAVPARRDYVYDAHYRLRQANGRVHQALLQNDYVPGSPNTVKGTRHLSLNNGMAIERFTRSYEYDDAGNLVSMKHAGASRSWVTTMWISATSNRSVPALDLNGNPIANPEGKFDADGNVRELPHLRRIEWNWRNSLARAVVIVRPGGTDDAERYVYGADGQRARKVARRVVQGDLVETTETVYFEDVERRRISRGDAVILERWSVRLNDGERLIALVHRWTKDNAAREVDDTGQARVHYQLPTHQGSSAIELDEGARVISYEEYFPYGGSAFIAGDKLREIAVKDYRYSAKECDDVTSLYYYGYRYYAPWMARWLSPDPTGPAEHLNLYQFVLADPVGNIDAAGLDTKPGDVVYVDRLRTAGTDDTAGSKVAVFRARLAPALQAGFDTLSTSQQNEFMNKPHMVLTFDPGSGAWVVISEQVFNKTYLPALIKWAKQHGKSVGIEQEPGNQPVTDDPSQTGPATTAPPTEQDGDAKGSGEGNAGAGGAGATGTGGGAGGSGGDAGAGDGSGAGTQGGTRKDAGDGTGGVGIGTGTGTGAGTLAGTGDGNIAGSDGSGGNGKGRGSTRGGSGTQADGGAGAGRGPGGGRGQPGGTGRPGSESGTVGGGPRGIPGGAPFSKGRGNSPNGHRDSLREGATGDGVGGGSSGGASHENGQGPSGKSHKDVHGIGGAGSSDQGPLSGTGTGTGQSATPYGNRGGHGLPGGQGEREGGHDLHGRGGVGGATNYWLEVAAKLNFEWDDTGPRGPKGVPGGSDPKGDEHGIPGGQGGFGMGGATWQQWLYIITSIINFVGMLYEAASLKFVQAVTELGQGLLKLGRALTTEVPKLARAGWRAGANALKFLLRDAGPELLVKLRTGAGVSSKFKFSEWLLWFRDAGGSTTATRIPGSWNYHAVVTNLERPGTWAFRDTAAHEGFHAWLYRNAGALTHAQKFSIGPIPVGAPLLWLEETFAYTIGRANALRFHAIPLAPIEAFTSMSSGRLFTLGVLTAAGTGGYWWFRHDTARPEPSGAR